MRHKFISGRSMVRVVAVGALALVLWSCGDESGGGQSGRTVDNLTSVACLPVNNSGVGGIIYSAERIEDGVAYGWLCMGNPDAPVR